MNYKFISFFIALLLTSFSSGKHLSRKTIRNTLQLNRLTNASVENIGVQPPLILLSCVWSKKFRIPVSNGNVMITCLHNQSEVDNMFSRDRMSNNYSESLLAGMQRKSEIYLSKNSIVTVCSLQCTRGIAVERKVPLPNTVLNEPNDFNIGCDNYTMMKCKEVSRLRKLMSQILGIFPSQLSRNTSYRRTSSCKRLISYNLRIPCVNALSKGDCLRRRCCWDPYLASTSMNRKYKCYKPKITSSDITVISQILGRLNRQPKSLAEMTAIVKTVINYYPADKQYTTKRISPENPKPCGCTSKSHLLPRCSNVVSSNNMLRPLTPNTSALNQMLLPNTRIFRGSDVKQTQWPWHAIITFKDNFCGGTLISARYVLTAAHCLTMQNGSVIKEGKVYLGVKDLRILDKGFQTRQAIDVVRHQNFSMAMNIYARNDLAVIKLDNEVDLSGPYVQPLCLPNLRIPRRSDKCFVTGFGQVGSNERHSEVLQQACVPLVPLTNCQTYYGRGVLASQHICAGEQTANAPDTCSGDSGGPLVCQRYGTSGTCGWYLAGVTSFGKTPCGSKAPSVYMNVYRYQSWIIQTIDGLRAST